MTTEIDLGPAGRALLAIVPGVRDEQLDLGGQVLRLLVAASMRGMRQQPVAEETLIHLIPYRRGEEVSDMSPGAIPLAEHHVVRSYAAASSPAIAHQRWPLSLNCDRPRRERQGR